MADSMDAIIARHLEQAGNMASGLELEPIGEDGHKIANLLWKVAAYLRNRRASGD